MTMTATTQEGVEACAHCGGPVSTRGRAPKSGRRYCSKNPGCRAAKARAQRRVLAVDRQAPTECSGCRKSLPPRDWRSGDELGRWCAKPICRRKRSALLEDVGSETDLAKANQRLENACIFLMEVVMADAEDYIHSNRVVCHTCGLTTAIPEWIHQDRVGEACMGTLNGVRVRPVGTPLALAGAWPFPRQYLSPEELEAAYGDPT